MTFTGYIRCFCATTSHDLVTFDLLTLGLFRVQCFSCLTHVSIFIILWLSDTELRLLNIWSHFPNRKVWNSHSAGAVTWPLTGGKNSPHFWNSWPQFAYSLCHFHGDTTKIKPCYRQKIAFSLYEGYKVYCVCAVSRDLCIGGRPKPHGTIFWPRIAYSLYNIYGATMTIKGSLYLSIPMLKRFLAAKNCPVKIGPPNWRFFGNLRVQI